MSPSAEPLSLTHRIAELVEARAIQLPPLPELAIKLQELLADEDRVDARKVAELVRNEPAVAASLLRIANSAAFGGLQEVTDLNQAVARLGYKQVGSIVTALLLKGNFETDASAHLQLHKTLWDHSVTTAFTARRLATRVGAEAEEAFMAGLLHDCGKLLVLKASSHLHEQGLEVDLTEAVLVELMETMHSELGFEMMTQWKLPPAICDVVRGHEKLSPDEDDPLMLCVQVANLISRKLGFHVEPDPDMELLEEVPVSLVGLSDVEVAALIIDLEDELDEVRSLF